MAYWVSRIILGNGKLVAENTLPADVNLFDGPTPNVGDKILVECRGIELLTTVVWIVYGLEGKPDRIRVQQISDEPSFSPLPVFRFWGYYINRVLLKDGTLVPRAELPQRPYHAPTPEIGDAVTIDCLGKHFKARVIGIDYAKGDAEDKKDYIQVEEVN